MSAAIATDALRGIRDNRQSRLPRAIHQRQIWMLSIDRCPLNEVSPK